MYAEEIKHKIKSILRLVIWILADILIYGIFGLLISKVEIPNTALLNLCKSMIDTAKIILLSLLLSLVLVIATNRKDTKSRWKKGVLELLAIAGFLYFCIFRQNQGFLFADIVLFIIVFLWMLERDTTYLNRFMVISSSSRRNEATLNYQTWYQGILAAVERFNAKEERLAEICKQYAESNWGRMKAEKDRISVDVKEKWNPQFFPVPWEPERDEYMGFKGLLHGRGVAEHYYFGVEEYINGLDTRYKKGELKRKELERWEGDTDNRIRFMEIDACMEERVGKIVHAGRVKRAKILRRGLFEKKKRHF